MTTLSRLGAALLVCAGLTQIASAQVITNGEIERGLRPGAPNAREPYTARYSYDLGIAPFYINGNSSQLYYLDYLDRVDRAAKFGYAMPVDPYFGGPPIPYPETTAPPRTFVGSVFGLIRRR